MRPYKQATGCGNPFLCVRRTARMASHEAVRVRKSLLSASLYTKTGSLCKSPLSWSLRLRSVTRLISKSGVQSIILEQSGVIRGAKQAPKPWPRKVGSREETSGLRTLSWCPPLASSGTFQVSKSNGFSELLHMLRQRDLKSFDGFFAV